MCCSNHSKSLMPYNLTNKGVTFEKINAKKKTEESLW